MAAGNSRVYFILLNESEMLSATNGRHIWLLIIVISIPPFFSQDFVKRLDGIWVYRPDLLPS